MRLIDGCGLAEKLQLRGQAAILAHDDGTLNGLRAALFELAYSPTVDAVPVVRCKDCIHKEVQFGTNFCKAWSMFVTKGDEGFCCYGERKER